MDRSLSSLGTLDMKTGAAVFFKDISMGLSVKMSSLMSSTIAKLQAIALAFECVPFSCSIDLFLDSQAILDAYKSELELVHLDFRNLMDHLHADIDWLRLSLVWYPNSHMAAGFTSKQTAGFWTYFMKALHY
ncbi:hypothetical protein G9A89_019041 [Geosiphon pyriformis]|nr:hypothetical protein G9A89_019041 [Geosiphon pyriformis]